jgi:hypothetical protein
MLLPMKPVRTHFRACALGFPFQFGKGPTYLYETLPTLADASTQVKGLADATAEEARAQGIALPAAAETVRDFARTVDSKITELTDRDWSCAYELQARQDYHPKLNKNRKWTAWPK